MNKLTIPAILVATVMVAGIFAFMPVEQASTVHTSATFLGNQNVFKTATDTQASVTAGQIVTIDLGAPFKIVSISFQCTSIVPTAGADTTTCQDEESIDVATFARDGETTDQTITLGLLAGLNTADTRILFLDGDAAPIAADITTLNLAAADNIAFTMANDITDTTAADNGWDLTVVVVVETDAGTTFDATDINFS